MKWYWKAIHLEEFGNLPKSERRRILKLHRNKVNRNWRMWLADAVYLLLLLLPLLYIRFLWLTNFYLLPTVLCIAFLFLTLHLRNLILRPHIRPELGLCPKCGYEFRQSTTRCPKCANPCTQETPSPTNPLRPPLPRSPPSA